MQQLSFISKHVIVLFKVASACTIVVACVVLHNMCVRGGDDLPPDDYQIVAGRRVYEEVPAVRFQNIHTAATTSVRTNLINSHFTH